MKLSTIFILGFFCVTVFIACKNEQAEAQRDVVEATVKTPVKRYGSVIKVKAEKLEEYKRLHADAWPGILTKLSECNIQNYSIFLKDEYLFGYFEYTGTDFDADMQKMAADSLTKEWWKLTDPCQTPLDSRKEGEWWASMEEVFHLD